MFKVKRFESQIILKSLGAIHQSAHEYMIAKIGYGHLAPAEGEEPYF